MWRHCRPSLAPPTTQFWPVHRGEAFYTPEISPVTAPNCPVLFYVMMVIAAGWRTLTSHSQSQYVNRHHLKNRNNVLYQLLRCLKCWINPTVLNSCSPFQEFTDLSPRYFTFCVQISSELIWSPKKKEKTKYDVITESKLRIRKKSINSRDGIILTTKYIHIHNTHSILSD